MRRIIETKTRLSIAGICIAALTASSAHADKISDECTFNGFKLYGKFKIVENFADIEVKVVTSFPDLKVKLVSNFADDCGEWTMVENFPDVKIKFVENFEDVKIEFVENFPGKP